jgi:hypothetical protein
MPPTLMTHDQARIGRFVDRVGGRGVVEPPDGAGGRSVMLLDRDDLNSNPLVEAATDEGHRPAMVQVYVPDARRGDKRILPDGDPLGAILRVTRPDDARGNLHVGGRAEPMERTAADRALVAAVGPRLRADGLAFVGLDAIGGRLTEVHVTSPTGVQDLARLTGSDPAARVLTWLEERAAALRTDRPRPAGAAAGSARQAEQNAPPADWAARPILRQGASPGRGRGVVRAAPSLPEARERRGQLPQCLVAVSRAAVTDTDVHDTAFGVPYAGRHLEHPERIL